MRLTDEEAQILLEVVNSRTPHLLRWVLLRGLQGIHPRQRAELQSALADELQASGFQRDWEPNRRGLALEHLIDAVPISDAEPDAAQRRPR